jgi:hypothetical protein
MMPFLYCHQPFSTWQYHPAVSKPGDVDCNKARLQARPLFPMIIAFLTYPIPFGDIQPSSGVDLNSIPRPVEASAIWFKTADS